MKNITETGMNHLSYILLSWIYIYVFMNSKNKNYNFWNCKRKYVVLIYSYFAIYVLINYIELVGTTSIVCILGWITENNRFLIADGCQIKVFLEERKLCSNHRIWLSSPVSGPCVIQVHLLSCASFSCFHS